MKIYYLYFLTVLFLVSCHSDVLEEEAAAPFFSKDPSPLLDSPLNPYNPFDYAGQIHNELLTLHYPVFHQTSAVDSIIGMVRFKTQEHNLLKNDTLSPIYASQIQFIIDYPVAAFQLQLSSSPLSLNTKNDFTHFITTLVRHLEQDESYAVIYDYIVAYEANLVSDVFLPPSEKNRLLMVTSLLRHSIYLKKKRPKRNTDPDWDWLTTSIYGATTGISSTVSTAIATSLITGIVLNP